MRSTDDRIRITYQLTLREGETPDAKAREVALEQTVELPDGCYPPQIEERIVGRVESLEQSAAREWKAIISYHPELVGAEVPQLLNLLFGMISMKLGILITGVDLPRSVLRTFPGPQFGIEGVRSASGVVGRPLLCSSAKPVGLSPAELAEICGALARGGIDIVKDDHGVTDQTCARFRERVERCSEAVANVNVQTGSRTLYFPNITAPVSQVQDRVEIARAAGCRGVLISPFLMGLDAVRWLAESADLILFSHPTLAGTFFHSRHGVAPEVLLGTILRILGSDGVLYVNAGGRFPVTEAECMAIHANLRRPIDGVRTAFPVPGGGVDVERVPHWIERYGVDTVFLIGSSLYAQSDLERASRDLLASVERHCSTEA